MESTETEIQGMVNATNRLLEEHRATGDLTSLEEAVLRGSLTRLSYTKIGSSAGYTAKTAKQAGYKLWKDLSKLLGKRVTKSNCRQKLHYLLDSVDQPATILVTNAVPVIDAVPPGQNREEDLSETSGCIGRSEEINYLMRQIQQGRQLILIGGLAGSGKTALVEALTEQAQGFDAVLRFRAEDIPTPEALCRALARHCQFSINETALGQSLQEFIFLLQQHRWLVVIDQTEALYQAGVLAGSLKPESSAYERWLKRLNDDRHRSCFLWVGRELPSFWRGIETKTINGLLLADACTLIQRTVYLTGTDADWQQLHTLCSGLPGLMRLVTNWIAEHCGQQIASFITSLHPLPAAFRNELQATLNRLSPIEVRLARQLVMQPLKYADLEALSRNGLRLQELHQAWESLHERGLLQAVQENASLQQLKPLLLELMLGEQLAEVIADELVSAEPNWLNSYPLLQPSEPIDRYSRRPRQREHILNLIKKFVQQRNMSEDTLQQAFLNTLERSRKYSNSYAVGNLINLAHCFNVSLAAWDFSGLIIRNADLRQVDLRQANFRGCTFQETVFPEGLSGNFVIALSSDGTAYAIGDTSGHVLVWQRAEARVTLNDFSRLNEAITALAFALDGPLVIASGTNVYFKWIGEQEVTLQPVFPTVANVSCLCISPNGEKLAVGLENGEIALWNLLNESSFGRLLGHTGEICALAFDPEGRSLVSCDSRNQINRWSISEDNNQQLVDTVPFVCRLESIFQALGWHNKHLKAIEVSSTRTDLHSEGQPVQKLSNAQTIASVFSANGRYLAGSCSDRNVRIWDLTSVNQTSVSLAFDQTPFDRFPVELALCAKGEILLTNTRECVQLWDISHQCCLWETLAVAQDISFTGLEFQEVRGLSSVTEAILRDLAV